ncbi:MAG: hypothetical protein L6V87_02870 [Ruminococcus sp.]|nr:MAG: hypothetical protein L6V87_02870 [Ruminococcus sp.]
MPFFHSHGVVELSHHIVKLGLLDTVIVMPDGYCHWRILIKELIVIFLFLYLRNPKEQTKE